MAACVEHSNLNIVKFLLQKWEDFKVINDYGNLLLHIASIYGKNNIFKYFIKNLKIIMIIQKVLSKNYNKTCIKRQKEMKKLKIKKAKNCKN